MNTDPSNNILQLFLDFLDQNPKLLQAICNSSMKATDNSWQFTLPELHQLARIYDIQLAELSYTGFRTQLFNSPVNQQLKHKNAEVVIIHNKNKVDLSTYCLQKSDTLNK